MSGARISPEQMALQEKLYTATVDGDVTWMEQLLHDGADPNFVCTVNDKAQKQIPGAGYLHIAASTMQIDSMQVLINWGADVNQKDQNDYTPLYRLCRNLVADGLEVLLDAGANPHISDKNGLTPRQVVQNSSRTDMADAAHCLEVLDKYEHTLPRVNVNKEPETLKERLMKTHQSDYTPLDNPQVWQQFESISDILLAQGTPLTKDDLHETGITGETVLERAARFRSLGKVLDHLHQQGEHLTVDEIVQDQPLIEAVMRYGAAPDLFSIQQLDKEGVGGMRRLQDMLGESAMLLVGNKHALRAQIEQSERTQVEGVGR